MFCTRALIFLVVVDAKRRGRRGRDDLSAKLARHRMHIYKRLVSYVFFAVLAPALLSFCYSLATDPAVPELARAFLSNVKARFAARVSVPRKLK